MTPAPVTETVSLEDYRQAQDDNQRLADLLAAEMAKVARLRDALDELQDMSHHLASRVQNDSAPVRPTTHYRALALVADMAAAALEAA